MATMRRSLRHVGRRLRLVPRWLAALLMTGGLAATTLVVAQLTHNWTILPTAVLVGSLAGPLAFGTWVADRTSVGRSVAPDVLVATFIVGGGVAIIISGVFDAAFYRAPRGGGFLWIALVEECSKVVVPLAICISLRSYRTVERALALGIVSAIGFAVLESMAYTVSALDESVKAARRVLFERSLVVPFGHLPWTVIVVIVAATEWQARDRATLSPRALWGLAAAIGLHTMWNLSLVWQGWWYVLVPIVATVTVGLFSLLLRGVHYDGPYVAPAARTP